MGWFESSEGSGVILGDDPLDATHRFLRELAEIYQEGCGRKPKLAEFIALLESGLKFSGGDCIEDLDERAVTHIVVETVKKPRDQKFNVGDVFAIPVGDVFAFGRIMYDGGKRGTLIEVFRELKQTEAFTQSIIDSGRLFGPVVTGGSVGRALKTWKWRVVASDPTYRISAKDRASEFIARDPSGRGWLAAPFQGRKYRPVSDEEASRLERGFLYNPDHIEDRIRKELGIQKS